MSDKTEALAIADRLRTMPPFNNCNLIMRPAEDVNAACDMLVAQAAEIARLQSEIQQERDRNRKPKWIDSPEWAQCLAQDQLGVWHWTTRQPVLKPEGWHFPGANVVALVPAPNWRESVEARP